MKTRIAVLLLGFTFSIATHVIPSSSSTGLYWIAFSHGTFSATPKFMIQIDAFGNVTIPPKRVVPVGKLGNKLSAVALAKNGADQLALWTFGGLRNERPALFRVLLSNPSLRFLGITKFPTISTNNLNWLSVTQRLNKNALAVSMETEPNSFLVGAQLTNQFSNGKMERLSQEPICVNPVGWINRCQYPDLFGGVISSDGAYSLLAKTPLPPTPNSTKLFIQKLNGNFIPFGKPNLLTSIPQPNASSSYYTGADVTRPLANKKRFVVYGTETASGVGRSRPNQIWLQVVNDEGTKIEPRISILNAPLADTRGASNIAVDPHGRFVVYACDVSENERNVLVFQALDGTGHPSGVHKVIAHDVALVGIDILEQ